jgi:hypothetical protein
MRSLTWQADVQGFVRDTPMGLVVLMAQAGNWLIAVHPHQ